MRLDCEDLTSNFVRHEAGGCTALEKMVAGVGDPPLAILGTASLALVLVTIVQGNVGDPIEVLPDF